LGPIGFDQNRVEVKNPVGLAGKISMKKLNKLFQISGVVTFFLAMSGCATIIKGDKQTVSINSNVRGATVLVNGEQVGTTPFTGPIKRKSGTTVTLRKDGFESKSVTMTTEIESVFWGNIISGGGFGSTTDLTTGAMYFYAPATLQVDLQRADQDSSARRNETGKKQGF
jgi:uncharacterized protein YceK